MKGRHVEILYEDELMKISSTRKYHHLDGGAVLLSFTGIGLGMGGIDVQNPEFLGAGKSFDNTVFITDKTRSWGNSLDFDLIYETIMPLCANCDNYAIGNSMGGFLAIVASHYLPIKTSISFVPQYSVNPLEVPWESRWLVYRNAIKNFSISNVSQYLVDTTRYYIFSGTSGPDQQHAELFPIKSNIYHYAFPELSHDLAVELKQRGLLRSIVRSCVAGDESLNINLNFNKLSPAY